MNTSKNLIEAVLYSIPIEYAILIKKFEKWAERKIRSFKGKKAKKK